MELTIKNSVDTDLKQRAVMYYKLLKHDIVTAEKIVIGEFDKFSEFFEDKNEEIREKLFLEFNTLSVVYQKPSEKFLKDNILKHTKAVHKKYYEPRNWVKKGPQRSTTADGAEEDGGDNDTTVASQKTTATVKTEP